MYRDSLEGTHECFCNFCGDDIEKKSQDLAQANFEIYKSEFEKKQKPHQVNSDNNEKSHQISEEMKDKFESEVKDTKKQLTAQIEVNSQLMDKI